MAQKKEANKKVLMELLKEPENKVCFECGTKEPRWASWNLGVFVCIRCAGFHRNMGTHISKMKSVTLDAWTDEQVASVADMGNARAREIYEANVPESYRRPTPESDNYAVEQWVRAKYEKKQFMARSGESPRASTERNGYASRQPRQPRPPSPVENTRAVTPTSPKKTPRQRATPAPATAKVDDAAPDLINMTGGAAAAVSDGFAQFEGSALPAGSQFFPSGQPQAAPRATKDQIMQLYNAPAVPAMPVMQQVHAMPGANYNAIPGAQGAAPYQNTPAAYYGYPQYPPLGANYAYVPASYAPMNPAGMPGAHLGYPTAYSAPNGFNNAVWEAR